MKFPHKKVIISTGSIIILLGIVSFVLYFLGVGIIEDYRALLATEKEEARIARDIENITKFGDLLKTHEAEFAGLEDIFINPDVPIPFIEFIESSAQSSQLTLITVPTDPKQVEGDVWPSMDFQLTLEGSYSNFIEFIERLEAAPYLVELRNLSMQKFTGKINQDKEGGRFTILVRAFIK